MRGILFDLDGTIFDIAERDAFSRFQALNHMGVKVSLGDVRKHYHYGVGRLGIMRKLGIKFSEVEVRAYLEACYAFFMLDKAVSLTKMHEGAYDVLDVLSKKFSLALVTSRDALSPTERELKRFNIKQFFPIIVTREVAAKRLGVERIPLLPFHDQRRKLYECAIELTKIPPAHTLCVGDSVVELEVARELGIKTVGVLTGFSGKKEMENSSITTVENLKQLAEMLR